MLDVVEVGWEGESEINSLTPTFSVSEVTWVVWGGQLSSCGLLGGLPALRELHFAGGT